MATIQRTRLAVDVTVPLSPMLESPVDTYACREQSVRIDEDDSCDDVATLATSATQLPATTYCAVATPPPTFTRGRRSSKMLVAEPASTRVSLSGSRFSRSASPGVPSKRTGSAASSSRNSASSQAQGPVRRSLLSVIAKTITGIVSNWSGINAIGATSQIHTPRSNKELCAILVASQTAARSAAATADIALSPSSVSPSVLSPNAGTIRMRDRLLRRPLALQRRRPSTTTGLSWTSKRSSTVARSDPTTTTTTTATTTAVVPDDSIAPLPASSSTRRSSETHDRTCKSQVRIVGSGMSYEKIVAVDNINDRSQVVVDLCNFSGLIELRAESAIFGAATPVNEVIASLGKHGKMLNCSPGVIGVQTLAGAIATGTHGQGMGQSCYGDTVISVDVVLPDGRFAHIDKTTTDPTLPPLGAVISSLGTLGVLTAIELTHSPRRVFSCRKMLCDYETFLLNYERWNQEIEFVKAWWFPETNKCHVWFVSEASDKEQQLFFAEPNCGRELVEFDMEATVGLNDTVSSYLDALFRDTGVTLADSAEHPHSLTLHRFADAKDVVGYLEQIVCKGIPVPQINCEIAVPMSQFKRATELLSNWARMHPQSLHYPFIYRATGAATQTMLYPSYGKNEGIAYIGFLVYLASDGTIRDDGMAIMDELQALLAKNCMGLPHMGKHFIPELYDFSLSNHKGMYLLSQWRKKLDPHGVLSNTFIDGLFDYVDCCNGETDLQDVAIGSLCITSPGGSPTR